MFKSRLGSAALRSVLIIEDRFSEPEMFRRHFEKLVVGEKFETLLETHLFCWYEPEGFLTSCGSHIRKIFLFAHIDIDISGFRSYAHDHSLVYGNAGLYEESAAILRVEEAVCICFTCLKCH